MSHYSPFCSGHNVTFLSGFPADFHVDGLVEITPTSFVQYIQNYTNWDLLGESLTDMNAKRVLCLLLIIHFLCCNPGRRMRNLMPVPVFDVMRYPIEVRKKIQLEMIY